MNPRLNCQTNSACPTNSPFLQPGPSSGLVLMLTLRGLHLTPSSLSPHGPQGLSAPGADPTPTCPAPSPPSALGTECRLLSLVSEALCDLVTADLSTPTSFLTLFYSTCHTADTLGIKTFGTHLTCHSATTSGPPAFRLGPLPLHTAGDISIQSTFHNPCNCV